MRPACLVLLALCAGSLHGAPSYTASGIVNAGNYAPGPFAPNSIVSLFGSGLARSTQGVTAADIQGVTLPTELNYTRVYVDNYPAPLFYVSEGQINFLIPGNQSIGPAIIRVVLQGNSGPEVTIAIVAAAPALFGTNTAIATHANNSLITPDAPATANEIIVVYATGLGRTTPNPATGAIPPYPAQILSLADLKITIGAVLVSADRIKYAGLTPGSAGLYQINLAVPDGTGTDPELRVAIGDQATPPGLKLPLR
jgi:uncharacterized protein (TIGR03437 family)